MGPPDRYSVALHEAGHAVIAERLGHRVNRVLIEEDPTIEPGGGTVIDLNPDALIEEYWRFPTEEVNERLRDYFVITLAGEAAIERAGRIIEDPDGAVGDHGIIADILRELREPNGELSVDIRGMVDDARQQARDLVADRVNWNAIEAIARALVEHGVLYSESIVRIIANEGGKVAPPESPPAVIKV